MNTREQFGRYLLLKKLSDDPLGETFRAGQLGEQGMERVVLLRVFNGFGLSGSELWNAVKDRADVQRSLKSPNIGDGVDMGEVRGIPYVAYDYVSGKDLATLLAQAEKHYQPIPTDHALLVTERIALALAVAYESRVRDQRILHGCLLPHLVMLSNEGETRLLGFEVAPGLRDFVARGQLGRYLAPEVRAGHPAHKSDDVFSVAAILLELLTGKGLPDQPMTDYGPLVDRAVLANDDTPLSPELSALLKRSLTTRDNRVGDVVAWHKTLSKLMFEGQFNPTTFNLAFFMHNIFRDDIEKESQEIEVERTMEIPVQALKAPAPAPPPPAPAPAPASETDLRDSTGVREDTVSVRERYGFEEEEKKKKKTGLLIGIAAAVVAVVVLGIVFLRPSSESSTQTAELPPTTTQAPAQPAPPPEPQGPSPEELQEKMRELIAEQASTMEENLRKQYEDQLAELQGQLEQAEEARLEAAARARREAEEQARREAEEQAQQEAEAAASAAAEAEAAEAEEEAAPEPTGEEPDAAPGQVAATTQPAPQKAPAPPPPPPSASTTPASTVRTGDLVTMGPGVSPPERTRGPQPRFPTMARRMNRRSATVVVRVLVDETGEVIDAEVKGDEVGFGFDQEALSAARRTQYKPATKDGVRVKMWVELKIDFRS